MNGVLYADSNLQSLSYGYNCRVWCGELLVITMLEVHSSSCDLQNNHGYHRLVLV